MKTIGCKSRSFGDSNATSTLHCVARCTFRASPAHTPPRHLQEKVPTLRHPRNPVSDASDFTSISFPDFVPFRTDRWTAENGRKAPLQWSRRVSRRFLLDCFRQPGKMSSAKNPRRMNGFSRWERAIFKSLAVLFIVHIATADPKRRHCRGIRSKSGSTLIHRKNHDRKSEPTPQPRDAPKIWK